MGGLIAGGLAISAATAVYAVRGRSSSLLGPSIYRGPANEPKIALTFDDGPSEGTGAILEILDRYRIPATFFQCGSNARRLPRAAAAVSAAGHEIGNHTHTHPPLWLKSRAFILSEITEAQKALVKVHDLAPRLFRAPYGVRWPGVRKAQQEHRLIGVMWTTIGLDWKLAAAGIVARLQRGLSNGAIFCLHDGRELASDPDIKETIEAVRQFVPRALDLGFRFETVTNLCLKNSPSA